MHPDNVFPRVYGTDANGQPVVGFGFSDLGKIANVAFNPIAQTRMLGNVLQHGASAVGSALGFGGHPMTPPPPQLSPNMTQAGALTGGNTIHAYMGLGAGVFASTGASGDLPNFSAEPQSSFIGNRLVLAARYTDGAAGLQVTITNPLTVSGMPQTPAPAVAAPIEMFDAQTTYSALDLQIATSATQISIGFSISATPGTGDTVAVSGGLYGQWIR